MTDTIVQDRTRIYGIIFSIAFATFMCTLDNYIVNISLPAIAQSLNININTVSLVVISYLLMMTGTILLFGKLGDSLGMVRVFIAGYIIFIIGSLLCGISSSITMLIISRCVQALGGSILYTIPSAIIPRYLPANMRGIAFGILTTSAAVGFTLGSPLGGFITSHSNWHWIFLINVPIGVIAVAIILKFFPREEKTIQTKQKFDFIGMLLSFFVLITMIYPLNMGRELGWKSPSILGSFLMSVIFLIVFVLWEKKCKYPLLDIGIFRHRNFTFANLGNLFVFMPAIGCNFILPFYLINGKGMKADQAGLVMITFSIVNMVAGPAAGKASDKISPRSLCLAGMVLTISACLFFAKTLYIPSLWPVILFQILTGISLGLFLSPNNSQIMSSAPEGSHGMASGILRTMTNLGSFIGVGLFEAILSMSFPHNTGKENTGNSTLHIPPEAIYSGLWKALIFASFLYFIALIFSFITADRKDKEK